MSKKKRTNGNDKIEAQISTSYHVIKKGMLQQFRDDCKKLGQEEGLRNDIGVILCGDRCTSQNPEFSPREEYAIDLVMKRITTKLQRELSALCNSPE